MPAYTTPLRRRAAVLALAALAAAGCRDVDDVLSVTDPDIIDPADARSLEGADAVRKGALTGLRAATSGGESMFHYGGLLADEWRSGDTFIQRDETDKRAVDPINANITTAMRNLHRARLSAQRAVRLLNEFAPNTPKSQVAEMYFVQAYVETLLAEHFCNGLVFSDVNEEAARPIYGTPQPNAETYARALAHADSGLAIVAGTGAFDQKIRQALQLVRARILLDLDRPADALAAIGGTSATTGVPTSFRYQVEHSQTTVDNQIWALNNNARRYTVSAGEGGVGLNFATANDPRVPACVGGSTACRNAGVTNSRVFDSGSTITLHVQLLWPMRESPVDIIRGEDARLIEAEAQLRAGNTTAAFATLNALRAATTPALPALVPAATQAGRVDQLFRERAFWQFSRGYRLGDLRRLIRQYGRTQEQVFPTGTFHKGGTYGTDVNFPLVQAEQNNPEVPQGQFCLDRNA